MIYAENQGKLSASSGDTEGKKDIMSGGASSKEKDIASSCERVQNAIKFFNDISFWAATMILLPVDADKRKETLEFMIKVMDLCVVCKNYNTAYAILLGLKLRAVSRLAVTFAQLSEDYQKRIAALCDLFSYQGSHKNYRGKCVHCFEHLYASCSIYAFAEWFACSLYVRLHPSLNTFTLTAHHSSRICVSHALSRYPIPGSPSERHNIL